MRKTVNARPTRRLPALLFLLVLCSSMTGQGNGGEQPLPAALMKELSARTHETWEGIYRYEGVSVVRIEGLRDLYVVTYRCENRAGGRSEGVLLDFAVVDDEGKLRFVYDTHEEVKGVTPVFEGLYVLPHEREAEVLLRWRHPGQGGLRSLQKYIYRGTSMELVGEAGLSWNRHDEQEWEKSQDLSRW